MRGSQLTRDTIRQHWNLHPEIDFLNHGSFGATPTVVLNAQRELILRLERDPIRFLAPERSLLPKLDGVRAIIAELVKAPARDIALVRNATEAVNAVLRSFPFRQGDEVVITDHGYNACNNAVRFAADRVGATVVVAAVPFPIRSGTEVMDAVASKLTERTRLLLVDHVTSPTGLVFPVKEIVQIAHRRGVRVMVDGAHAPGMLPVDLTTIDADYYAANHHKWLCGPKSSAFLYVRRRFQSEVRPTTIGHGANTDRFGDSKFLAEFNWPGTFDPTPVLALPVAIEFLSSLHAGGMPELMATNRELAVAARRLMLGKLNLDEPAPADMLGSLEQYERLADALIECQASAK